MFDGLGGDASGCWPENRRSEKVTEQRSSGGGRMSEGAKKLALRVGG